LPCLSLHDQGCRTSHLDEFFILLLDAIESKLEFLIGDVLRLANFDGDGDSDV
jgi:hypothetical protein